MRTVDDPLTAVDAPSAETDAPLLAVDAPTAGSLSADADDVRDVASCGADEADLTRRLSAQVVESLVRAGFARQFVPRRYGGTGGGFLDLLRAAARVAEGCPSAGWCGSLFAAHGRLAAYLPCRGQQELWARSPDTVIAAAVMQPRLTAEPVPGGWLLSGRWSPASGVDHAEWMLLSALTSADDGPGGRIFAVPIAECEIQDTWQTPGMRGTGSNTVVLDRVLVPEYRTVTRARLLSWERSAGAARCHGVVYPLVAALIFAGPVLGAARGAVACWQELMASQLLDADAGDGAAAVQVLARSTGELQAATLLLENAAGRADSPDLVSALAVAENLRDCTLAVELCVSAADRLAARPLDALGGKDAPAGARLRRLTQDVSVASGHAMLRFAPAVADYAKAVLATPFE